MDSPAAWTLEAFDAAVRGHDRLLAARGVTVWVGSEPTFTDRAAQTPEWLGSALGGQKEQRAQELLAALCRRFPGGMVLRSVGRQYPGEPRARWNLGLYRRRDGQPLWAGPSDPLLAEAPGDTSDAAPAPGASETSAGPDLPGLAQALARALSARGLPCSPLTVQREGECRCLMRTSPELALPDADDPRLARPSVHDQPIPSGGLRDELAEAGLYLFLLRADAAAGRPVARVELPQLPDPALFQTVAQALAQAAAAVALPWLVLAGHPPPADAEVEHTTVTPDPAVIEINTAPSVDAHTFLQRSRAIYEAAAQEGLAPYRLYFNGTVADSGGGGQITLGGPTVGESPFLLHPRLLPRLVRFFNHHPSLSYLFSHDHVGSGGQSVRPDERGSDAFDELGLALALLAAQRELPPELLWHSLAPFLCDMYGNSHRAEINIEKLWNPFLAGRGRQGLVEFRALRMQHTPERATALACLLRALVAMLATEPYEAPLVDWGRDLHQRFALPFYLEQDLCAVLQALAEAGLGLGEPLHAVLRRESFRRWGQATLEGATLEIRRALEFWPLLGDAASPEQAGGSRLVDASTARVELRLRPVPAAQGGATLPWHGWQVYAAGVKLPLRAESDAQGELRVYGLRYRSFRPTWGLHPALGAQTPLQLTLVHPARPQPLQLTLHEWHPQGWAYPGLPQDLAEAAQRRADRVQLQPMPPGEALPAEQAALAASAPPPRGLGAYCLDLRGSA